jgi:hypothetical protein
LRFVAPLAVKKNFLIILFVLKVQFFKTTFVITEQFNNENNTYRCYRVLGSHIMYEILGFYHK